METITFYSYKGGVGRTLALANVGHYLALLGKKVFAVDFDLEAPGLHYKLLGDSEQRLGILDGLVDYILDARAGSRDVDLARYSQEVVTLTGRKGSCGSCQLGPPLILSTGPS